jgi:hypothetical protein
MSVLLHIGLFKTGNQSIQSFLRNHERLLAAHNARFPRGWLRLNCHLEPHMVFLRGDRLSSARVKGDEWKDPHWCADVVAQIRADLDRHPDELTVLSGEHNSLFRFDDEFERLRDLVGDATIVVYLRNRLDWLASLRDELEKYSDVGTTKTDPDAYNYIEPDSWLVDYDERLKTWRRWFSDVRVIDYDEVRDRDGGVIPSFLRQLGITPNSYVTADANLYWLNRRGTLNEGRVPGVRWIGGRFGDDPAHHAESA